VVPLLAAVTARPHARRPVQRVDLQPGIVRQHPSRDLAADGQRLERRVLEKGRAGLLDRRQTGKIVHVPHLVAVAEHLADLPRLVRVAGGDDQERAFGRHAPA